MNNEMDTTMGASMDYDLVSIDEFDALAIELKTPLSNKYPAKAHARKVAKELGVDGGIIYLPGKLDQTWEDSDMGPPFRQRRHFYYLSGADFSGCAVTYDIGADTLILWIPYSPPSMVLWFGKSPSPKQCLEKSDLDDVKYIPNLAKYLTPTLAMVGKLFVLRESQIPKLDSWEQLKPHLKLDTSSLLPAISEARVVKDDYEVAMIRKANQISSAAHRTVCEKLLSFKNECEIEAAFSAACVAENSHMQSYPIIAGSGVNAACLHYDANNEPLKGRQLVVLDAGCEWNVHASDVTRTLPISGKFTKEGKAIYDIVAQMQDECISRIKPGTVFYSLHLHAHLVAIKGLMKLGILHNGSVKEIFASGTSSAFFPHGLGHHVGLEVHDVGGKERLMMLNDKAATGSKRMHIGPAMLQAMIEMASNNAAGPPYSGRRQLEPNMIVTIEPGIYFCREYIEAYFLQVPERSKFINTEVLDMYWDVGGVRIEDCILVTDDGHENLTTAPKGDEMLKIINGK